MFFWTDESISWYQSASEWTGYHRRLAEELTEFLKKDDEIYDIGCGLGILSVLLSPVVKQVTAVDIEPRVLKKLRDMMEKEEIHNIIPVETDWHRLPENSCDTVIACSFGSVERDFYNMIRLARKKLIVIKRSEQNENNGFITGYNREFGANRDRAFLEQEHIPYEARMFQADFGQPLHDREEANRYINHYRLKPENSTVEQYLKQHRLSDTENGYEYYLPNKKNIHIMVIERADVAV